MKVVIFLLSFFALSLVSLADEGLPLETEPTGPCSADTGVYGKYPSSCGCPEFYSYGGANSGKCLLQTEIEPTGACSADAGVYGPYPSSCSCPDFYSYSGENSGKCFLKTTL